MIQTVNINVAALPALRGPGSFMVLSQNENGRQIRFRILGSDLPTGCTATFSGTKPDGNVYSTTGTVSGNFVIVQEDIQMTAVAGIWDAKLEIAKGTENIVTSIIRVTVVRDPVAGDAIPSDSQLDGIVTEVKYYAEHARSEAYGSPLTASTKSAMTDKTRVYVYTGSESGMTAGNWYYWNGSAWTSGGVYNAVAVQTDTTLSVAGKAADAKKTGDEISSLKEDLSDTQKYCGITDTSFESQEGKKFITPSGSISSASGNYHISNPIPISAGDEVHFTCTVVGANVVVISLCDSNGENIIPVVVGVSGNISNEYIYAVQEDGYIILSYRYDLDYKLYILNAKSNNILNDRVGSNTRLLNDFCGITDKKFVYVNGKYYIGTQTETISPATGTYHVTKPIAVTKGEKIIFIATPVPSGGVIATCNSDSTNISIKVTAGSDTGEQKFEYDVDADGYVILSYDYSQRAKLFILDEYANIRISEKLAGITKEKYNLINHRTLIDNKSITNNGVLTDNVQYVTTQKISVEPETIYAYRNIYRIVYFKKDDTKISVTNIYAQIGTGTFTTPANTAYIIASMMKYNTQIGKVYDSTEWEIIKGDSVVPYTQQQIEINGYRVADSTPITHDAITEFRRWDKICYDKQPVVFAEAESEATTAEDRTTSGIIAHYDALMGANTGYITKTALGTASDGTTTIYRYDFVTPGAKLASGSRAISTNEKTKIILISGVHPEFGGIYGLYNAMREITSNPNLRDIKNGVHFIVIPTVNPYGIDTKNRKNANGVDIARNFEIDFVPGTDQASATYAGTAPLSEPESVIVDSVLSANSDAIIFASCHSFQLSADGNVIWGSCGTMYATNVTAKLVVKMTEAWKNKYPSMIPQTLSTILGSAGISTETGSEGKQAAKYGIQGLTLETSDYFPYNDSENPHTAFAMSRNSETYINFIKTALGLWEASDPKDLSLIGLH